MYLESAVLSEGVLNLLLAVAQQDFGGLSLGRQWMFDPPVLEVPLLISDTGHFLFSQVDVQVGLLGYLGQLAGPAKWTVAL